MKRKLVVAKEVKDPLNVHIREIVPLIEDKNLADGLLRDLTTLGILTVREAADVMKRVNGNFTRLTDRSLGVLLTEHESDVLGVVIFLLVWQLDAENSWFDENWDVPAVEEIRQMGIKVDTVLNQADSEDDEVLDLTDLPDEEDPIEVAPDGELGEAVVQTPVRVNNPVSANGQNHPNFLQRLDAKMRQRFAYLLNR